jgi:hypothetical protein
MRELLRRDRGCDRLTVYEHAIAIEDDQGVPACVICGG